MVSAETISCGVLFDGLDLTHGVAAMICGLIVYIKLVGFR